MPLPIIFPGDEVTVLYRDGLIDGPNEIECFVVEVTPDGLDLGLVADPELPVWTALFSEEQRGDWRLIDHRPAPKRPLTEEDIR